MMSCRQSVSAIPRCWEVFNRGSYPVQLIRTLIVSMLLQSIHGGSIGIVTSGPYNWCRSRFSGVTRSAFRTDMLQESLQESYDWDSVGTHLEMVVELTRESALYSSIVLNTVHHHNNLMSHKELEEKGNILVDDVPDMPVAVRLTSDNEIVLPLYKADMAAHTSRVIKQQAENLVRMLERLDVMRQTTDIIQLQQELSFYIGEIEVVLCTMQEVFRSVPSGLEFPSRYNNAVTFEEKQVMASVGLISDIYRYGVIARQRDILGVTKADMSQLWLLVVEHYVT